MAKLFRKSFFSKKRDWFIAYALILLLPIIFNFISFFYTESALEKKVRSANILSLQSSQNYIDNALSSIVQASISLSDNHDLINLSKQSEGLSASDRYDLTKLNDIWQMHNIFSSDISKRIVYFPQSDSVYASGQILSVVNCFNLLYLADNTSTDNQPFSPEEFKNILLANKLPGFISFETTSGTKLFHSYPVSEYTSDDISFNIIVELNLDHLLFQSRKQSGAEFFIAMPDGKVLHNSLSPDEVQAVADTVNTSSSFETVKKNGEKYVTMKTASTVSDWTYGTIMPYSEYRKTLPMTRELTYTCIMLCVVLGIALIYWLTNKTYLPLKSISEMFRHSSSETQTSDIYTSIKKSVEAIQTKNADLINRFDEQSDTLKQTVLTNIIYGKTNDKLSYNAQLEMIDVKMDKNMFSVIIVGAENNAMGIFSAYEGDELSDSEKQMLSKVIISNICHEMLSEEFICEPLITDAFVTFIVNYDTDKDGFRNKLEDIFRRAADIISSEFSFKILTAVSNPKISADTVSSAYREAVLCFEHLCHSDSEILFYEDLLSRNSGFLLDFPQFHKDIEQALSERNYKECRSIIKATIYSIQQSKAITPEMARIFACDILRIMMNSSLISASDRTKSLLVSAEYDRIMSESSTVSSILLRTMNIIDSYLRDYIEIDEEKTTGEIYEHVKEYIDNHYSDTELSAAQLSEHFGISSAYLSTQFKLKYDIGILDYIRKIRIDKAKELLKSTDMKNEDISACVGYINARTFLRAFSKVEGITPKEFRKINK